MTDADAETSSERMTKAIAGIPDWRGAVLARIRTLIRAAAPQVVEEMKWVKPSNPTGVPTWSHRGVICTGEVYNGKVKITFAQGARLKDPSKLFNSSLAGNQRRAIDILEDDGLDAKAFAALIKEAIAFNESRAGARSR